MGKLPNTVAALEKLEASEAVQTWFGPVFLEAYLRHKRSEIAHVTGVDAAELCRRYEAIY
jgi:glutamine synthetase